MSLISRFRNLWRERELGREFDEELRFHLETRIERNMARGMTTAEAGTEARHHLGSLTQTREGMRNAQTTYGIDALRQDLVHGARVFRRQPALTGLVLLMLSLGIGANTAIFSLLHAAMSPPLPFREPGRVVYLVEGYQGDGSLNRPSIPALLDVRARSRTFEAVSYYSGGTFQVAGGAEPEQVSGVRVEPTLFALLGVTPAMGRVFIEADGVAGSRLDGAGAVVVVSDGFWRRNLGANPGAVGATLTIDAEPHRIVGVLAPGPSLESLTGRVDIFLPQNPSAADVNWPGVEAANYVPRTTGIGRLAPGVSIAQASAELGSIAASIAGCR